MAEDGTLGLPSGNQTWLAGKSPINGGFSRKITYKLFFFFLLCLITGGYPEDWDTSKKNLGIQDEKPSEEIHIEGARNWPVS